MKNRIYISKIVVIMSICILFLTACNEGEQVGTQLLDTEKAIAFKSDLSLGAFDIFYLNKDKTSLITQTIDLSEAVSQDEAIKLVMEALINVPQDKNLSKSIPEYVVIKDIKYGKQTEVYFDSSYYEMESVEEILCRAAIVLTLTQFEEIEFVEFYVNDQKFLADGKPVGLMQASDFIGAISSAQEIALKLYFSDSEGKHLIEENRVISASSNITLEQEVIEQLILGPQQEGLLPTLSQDTRLSKIVVKDGICYLDFNEEFTAKGLGVNEEITIYSIVNSLVELQGINKVQFLVNGEKKAVFKEKLRLDDLFDRNLDLILAN